MLHSPSYSKNSVVFPALTRHGLSSVTVVWPSVFLHFFLSLLRKIVVGIIIIIFVSPFYFFQTDL